MILILMILICFEIFELFLCLNWRLCPKVGHRKSILVIRIALLENRRDDLQENRKRGCLNQVLSVSNPDREKIKLIIHTYSSHPSIFHKSDILSTFSVN